MKVMNAMFVFQFWLVIGLMKHVPLVAADGIEYQEEVSLVFETSIDTIPIMEDSKDISKSDKEDEIIKRIEDGDFQLPLRNNLIEDSGFYSGPLGELQFGKLWLEMIAAQQKFQKEQLQIQGSAELQEFEVYADDYDANRHFFISHYNRNQFEGALNELPQIFSLFRIIRMEVWVTDDSIGTERHRDIVALADIGETEFFHSPDMVKVSEAPFAKDLYDVALPDNTSNDLYNRLIASSISRTADRIIFDLQGGSFQMTPTKDFEKIRARLLRPDEYTFHPSLGFISLNVNLRPDQVLGVAYQYSYRGEVHSVGEFSQEVPKDSDSQEVLFVKLLKSSTLRADLPTWDLMMKNFYSIGAYNVGRENFKLDVFYEDPIVGERRFLSEGNLFQMPLIRVFNLDNLNALGDPLRDGVFDFIPGLTINTQTGRIMFPMLEPFGSSLARQIDEPELVKRYAYPQLYNSTLTEARGFTELNRFKIVGSFKSCVSSEISLGAFNLPEGSVTVKAGGKVLQEGIDYEVDYNIGRLKILNEVLLHSGTPINIFFE